ncbi:hypothetical protein CEXT_808461 [Caerostris extrusa]|uniref:Uncharacterized protein n=1 Tax=Caerostris extrusa TaxID=172846 RepID=A0AAV4S4M9_CAEEX|nr:hypothetical protein CEXT_808461 [Caerostris extrusa]
MHLVAFCGTQNSILDNKAPGGVPFKDSKESAVELNENALGGFFVEHRTPFSTTKLREGIFIGFYLSVWIIEKSQVFKSV